jgi:hypothetical protein
MAKNYILILGLLTSSIGFSQKIKNQLKPLPAQGLSTSVNEKALINSIIQNKDGEVLVWEDNFSDPSTWTINNSGLNQETFGWDIGSTENSWYFNSVINSTSGGNFAELNNGNASTSTQALDVVYTLTTAAPINVMDLAGSNLVKLTFQQYGARFNDAQEIYISEDGVSFIKVGDNSDIPVLSAAGGSAYANPTLKSINLGQFLSANPTQVWIRFSWTTAFPNSASNPNVWITYGWMIDDVQLLTYPSNDLSLNKLFWGSTGAWGTIPTYIIPEAQRAPIEFAGVIENKGSSAQSNVVFNVTGTSFTGSSSPVDLGILISDTVETTTQFTPPTGVANYTLNFNVTSPEDDVNPTDNSLPSETFAVSQTVYAVDKGVPDNYYGNQGFGFETGNVFNIFQNATLTGAQVNLNSGTAVGTQLYVKLYEVDENATTFAAAFMDMYESQNLYTVTNNDLGNWVNIPFETPQFLEGGKAYTLVVGSYGSGGTTNDFRCNSSGRTEPGNSVYYDLETGTWYYTIQALMVRMDFAAQTPIISSNDDDNIACEGQSITLSSSINTGNQWNLNGNPISGATSSVYQATTTGSYTVTNTGLTSSSIILTFNDCASLLEETKKLLVIYPNPTSENFTIKGENLSSFSSIELQDNLGRIVDTWSIINNATIYSIKNISKGNYNIVIKGNQETIVKKIQIN